MKLVKRNEIPREICYDLSVQKNHNFFANGICVHNTHGAYVESPTGECWFQSRENIITPEKDNAGFAMFGEWCGGGIQKGVALNQLLKMFVIFGIALVDADGQKQYLTRKQVEEV